LCGVWLDVETGFVAFVSVAVGGLGEDAGSAVVEAALLDVVDGQTISHVKRMRIVFSISALASDCRPMIVEAPCGGDI
jgi:hypothetical protein